MIARPSLQILQNIDGHWRAADYLFVGQIYLKANPLLEVRSIPAYQVAIAGTSRDDAGCQLPLRAAQPDQSTPLILI
jgi:hypothetical protein